MPTNEPETDAWPTCPEEFTKVMEPLSRLTSDAHIKPSNTTATSPRVQTVALQTYYVPVYDSVPSTPYTLLDQVIASSPNLLTPPLNCASLDVKPAPTRVHRYLVPPVGGYKDNKLDYKLAPKIRKPIEMTDSRGPNSDLGDGRPYEKEIEDINGDVVMQETIWTTKQRTLFLVSVSFPHCETAANQLQRRRFDTVLISSTMDGIPSLVITAPEETRMPEQVNTNSDAPRAKRNNDFDQDIPVYANGVWTPVDVRKRKTNN